MKTKTIRVGLWRDDPVGKCIKTAQQLTDFGWRVKRHIEIGNFFVSIVLEKEESNEQG